MMTTPSADPICVRNSLLQHVLLGKRKLFDGEKDQPQLTKDGLIDAMLVLYDECSTAISTKDETTVNFVDKYHPVVTKLKKLRVNAADFEQKKVIGRGHFGEVFLVKEKQTGDVYAMKIMKKKDILAKQNIAFYEEEKDIMAKASSDWLTALHCSFQDHENLYLVMEFHPGGDLLSLLNRRDGALSEDEARFYLAEMVMALHTLHTMGYVHRDVKPENVLLDRLGHIKLADFGSAAKLDSTSLVRSEMAVGTAEYIAPEVLTSMNNVGLLAGGYGVECDFWSLGVMAYEMVYGETPFGAEKMSTVYGNIMNYKNSLKFPENTSISPEFRNLIKELLCDAKSRLGYQQLISHSFFASIDWNALREKSPPYVPVITSMDDTSNFEEFESEGLLSHSTVNLRNTQSAITRDLPFIGFTHVKENGFNFQLDLNAGNDQVRRIKELEQELNLKTKEIVELKKHKLQYEHEKGDLSNVERLQEKIKRIEKERDNLEKLLHQAQREANHHRRLLEMEQCERVKNDAKVVEMIKDIKVNWEKASEKERSELKREIQVWKQYHAESQLKAEEYADLLKEAMATTSKLEEDCKYWKVRAVKYKELSVRGQRVEEKRASVSFGPINEQLIQTQQQLEKERIVKADLKSKIEVLEDRLREAQTNFAKELEDKEKEWVITSTERETEYQHKISDLEDKVLRQKESRIKELEARLDAQMNECQNLRDHADQLQKSLDSTLQWRNSFETSFTVREGELETRIKQLEGELRATTDIRIELQKQVSEITQREANNVQKLETTIINMRDAVERLERKNQELSAQLSVNSSSNTLTAASMSVHEVDELKQRIVFLEEQIAKLEQQLEKAREHLTLEKEKARHTQTDLWKKEKELSDAKIDLRIANRETKTSETENAKIKEELKLLNERVKEKDSTIETMHSELSKLRLEFNETQRSLTEKEKDLADASKAVQTTRDLKRELQYVKDEMAICQRLKSTLESEVQRAEERVKRQTEEKNELKQRLDEKSKQIKDLENELRLLKDTMATMDEQLQEFEGLVEGSDKKQLEFESDKSKLSQEIERLKQEIRAAKAQANEEKSLKLFSESKLRDVEARLKSCEADTDSRIDTLKKQLEEYSEANKELNERVSQIENQLAEAEAAVDTLSRKCGILEEDNYKLQEESSALRTQLFSVKSSNAVLSEGLEEAISKAEDYKTRITQLETQIETTRVMYKERELKYESTIAQQTKLIDFLQSKAEQPKKKPTLTDKLFGSHKKENQPTYHTGYRDLEANLEKKTAQCRSLTDQLNKCKAELAALKESTISNRTGTLLKTPIADVHTRSQATTPLPNRALSRLTQSPGTQCSPTSSSSLGLASQRMHHKIPHRLQNQMVMRATNCNVCLDSIHFGRQVSVCQECYATAHVKCATHLPNTCGLPVGLAEHFGQVVTHEPTDRSGDSSAPSAFQMKGWVKVQRPGKATCWDRKFMKLNGTQICIYDHEPTSDLMEPIDSLELQPTDGSTVAVHSAVAQTEVLSTAKTDVPYIFMVESNPGTTCWPGRSLFIMALNFHDKKAWVDALEKVAKGASKNKSALEAHRKPKVILSLDIPIDVNCTVTIGEGIMLIGAKEGLFSYRLQKNNKQLVKIEGVTDVQQIVIVPKLSAVMMIVGEGRHLVMTELRVLQGCAEAIQSAEPTLQVEAVPNCDDIHLFQVSNLTGRDDIFLCAATRDRVKLFKWNFNSSSFISRKELIVSETCSCIHFTEHSVLVGCDRFYEVDLGNFTVEEFLDASDSSLAYVVFGLKQGHSFPIAIFDVTMHRGDTEFLLCYHEFGVFVDEYGRRSRPEDVKWSRLPLGFVYRKPYLCVLHFDSVEVMRLTSTSFRGKSDSSSDGESLSSAQSVAPVPSVFIYMHEPRYLGPGPDAGSNYFFSNKGDTADLVQLDAALALGENDPNHPVHPDDFSSITGSQLSLERILDTTHDSTSTVPDVSPFKRAQAGQEAVRESKRVKFESDL